MSNVTISWSKPTTRGGGAVALPASEIEYFRVYKSVNGGARSLQAQVPGVNTSMSITNVSPNGTWVFDVTAVDTLGQEGAASDPQSVVIGTPAPPPAPDKPTNVQVSVS